MSREGVVAWGLMVYSSSSVVVFLTTATSLVILSEGGGCDFLFLEICVICRAKRGRCFYATGGKKRKVRIVNFLSVLPGVVVGSFQIFFSLWADFIVGAGRKLRPVCGGNWTPCPIGLPQLTGCISATDNSTVSATLSQLPYSKKSRCLFLSPMIAEPPLISP